MNLRNILTIAFYSIVVICLLYGLGYLIWFGGGPTKGAGFSITLAIILLVVAALATLGASIINMIHHPKAALKSLVGIGVLVIIALIGYSVSKGEILDKYLDFGVTEAGQSKLVDAGLYLMYGTGAIALIAIIAAEVNAIFKN